VFLFLFEYLCFDLNLFKIKIRKKTKNCLLRNQEIGKFVKSFLFLTIFMYLNYFYFIDKKSKDREYELKMEELEKKFKDRILELEDENNKYFEMFIAYFIYLFIYLSVIIFFLALVVWKKKEKMILFQKGVIIIFSFFFNKYLMKVNLMNLKHIMKRLLE
jgi:hypothetical protein